MLKERNIQKILNSIEVKDTMGGGGRSGWGTRNQNTKANRK